MFLFLSLLSALVFAEAQPVRITDKTGATNVTVTAEPSSHQALDVAAYQSTSPWVTSRNWTLSSPGDSVQCTQGSPPWSVSQSGTWTVQQGTPPWSVSQSGAWTTGRTWTLSSGSDSVSAVQSGPWTVTANAGTNLNTSALALDSTLQLLTLGQASTTSGEKGPLVQGAVTTVAPSYTTGQTDPLSLTTSGALRVDGSGVTQPVSGTVTANQGTSPWVTSRNWTLSSGTDSVAATQSGTWTVQPGNTANTTPWLTTINQGGNSATVTASNALKVDGSAVTQPVSGTVTANQGTSPWTENVSQFGGNAVQTGTGASGNGVPRVTVANDSYLTDRNVTGNLTSACSTGVSCAASSVLVAKTDGASSVGFETHGTWSATITQDVSYDTNCFSSQASANWYNVGALDTDASENTLLTSWTNARNQDPWSVPVGGTQCFRLRISSYTSGTVNATIDVGIGNAAVFAVADGNVAAGTADQGNPIKTGAVFHSTLPTFADGNRTDLQSDSRGRLIVTDTNQADVLQSGNFIADTNAVSISSTSETPLFLMKNPNGSGKKIVIRLFQIFAGLSSTQVSQWRVYLDPTITANGTSLTPQNMYFQTSPPSPVATAFKSPTISANGTFISLFFQLAGSLNQPEQNFDFVVDPNHNVLVTVQTSSPNVNHNVHLIWSEE